MQADFYQLFDAADNARLKLACRLASKAFEAKQNLYIHCSDSDEAKIMDDLLWTFHDVGFIPHALVGGTHADEASILIGSGNLPHKFAAILLNLDANIPDGAENYPRIIEVVAANDAAQKIAREHEKIYLQWNKKINKHEIK